MSYWKDIEAAWDNEVLSLCDGSGGLNKRQLRVGGRANKVAYEISMRDFLAKLPTLKTGRAQIAPNTLEQPYGE